MKDDNRPVAFQGEPGANGDLAARSVFPGRPTLPCFSFEDVFAAVEDGSAAYALIPIDNSIAGRVAVIHALLPHSTTHIIGEHFQPIEHKLLGIPGSTLETIKTVRSHVHALAQSRKFLNEHKYRSEVAQDTAGAAREVAEMGDTSVTAIAPALAGELYGLVELASDISDAPNNTTRFLVLSLEKVMPPQNETPVITSIFFRTRSVPAALYKAIGGFAANSIDLLKIESYLGDDFKLADFYIEAQAHPQNIGMQHAMDELRFFSEKIRVLGTYPADPFRQQAK